jgi:hypothetical protein
MKTTRREAIRTCFFFAIGTALIPSCMQEEDKAATAYNRIKINGHQEKLISELSETIIPATDTPGSKDTYTHLFVLKMLDDCYSKDDQQQFLNGMKEFEKFSETKFGKSFLKCNALQREELVKDFLNDKQLSKENSFFFDVTKKLTIQGYVTSKYYLTTIQVYQLVPGKFKGNIPVSSLKQMEATI